MASENGYEATKTPADFQIQRFDIDLTAKEVRHAPVQCEDLEDAFGGIARGFKLLEECPVENPYDPSAKLIFNLGILSGTAKYDQVVATRFQHLWKA